MAMLEAQRLMQAKLEAYGNSYVGYLRILYNIPSPYNNEYVLKNYGGSADYSNYLSLTKNNNSLFYGGSTVIPSYGSSQVSGGLIPNPAIPWELGFRIARPYWELAYGGWMHHEVVQYLATKHGLKPEQWNFPYRYDLYNPLTREIWEVKPVTYLPGTYLHSRLIDQYERYLKQGNINGQALGNDQITRGGYKVRIYSNDNSGYVFYDFWREEERQPQTQTQTAAKPVESSSYVVNPFTGATNDYYDTLPRTNPFDTSTVVSGILVTAAAVIIIGTIAEDIATGGIGIADDPASIAFAMWLVSQGAKVA
jgi:hypothetical protein